MSLARSLLLLATASAAITLGCVAPDGAVVAGPDAGVDDTIAVARLDAIPLVVSATSFTITEGTSAALRVHLAMPPAANVFVTVTSSDPSGAYTQMPGVGFTPTSWSQDQIVMVYAPSNNDLLDRHATLSLTGPGLVTTSIAVFAPNRTMLGVVASPATLSLTEGSTAPVSVQLNARPLTSVVVKITSSDPGAVATNPAALTFTPDTWATPQTVAVNGVIDLDSANEQATLTFDGNSGGASIPAFVKVAVTDRGGPAIDLSATSLQVNEGQTASLQVRLTAPPTTATQVTLATADAGAMTATPATLTFTPSNWNVYQTIRVTGVVDADAAAEDVLLTADVVGMPAPRTALVHVIDSDRLGIAVSTTAVTLGEGGTATFAVHLTAQPTSPSTAVVVSSSDRGAAEISVSPLLFTPANYATPQVVTISGVADADGANERVTISLVSPPLPTVAVTATVLDSKPQALVIQRGPELACQGKELTLTVALAAQPTSPVTVNLGATTADPVGLSAFSLTFTATNWSTPQTVTLSWLFPGSQVLQIASAGLASDVHTYDVIAASDLRCR